MGLIGDYFQGKNAAAAATDAGNIQFAGTENARAVGDQIMNRGREDDRQFLQTGGNASHRLDMGLNDGTLYAGFNPASAGLAKTFSYSPADMQNDPAYAFTRDQGIQAEQRSAAAQGGLVSGGAMKDIANYTTGLANQFYNQDYARAQDTYNQNYARAFQTFETDGTNKFDRMAALSGQGLQAAQQNNILGLTTANNAEQLITNGTNALAAAKVGRSNAWNAAINNGGNTISQAAALMFG